MQTGKRHIRNGQEFNHFFGKPTGRNITVKNEANLSDTIEWMKKVVQTTKSQSKKIAKRLQGESVRETCSNVWNFCFHHFQYEKDEEQKEQIRTPNRSWRDRTKGIDCDCFSVLISTILTNLKIPHIWRMTRYQAPQMEHIYPVAFAPNGKEIIIDCVVSEFNYEVPYTAKEDVNMELQVLDGVKGERYNEFGDRVLFENDLPIDAQDLFLNEMELDGLGSLKDWRERQRAKKAKRKENRSENKKLPIKERIKNGLKKGLNVINKLNPAAAILRAGILASMKLNVFKVASHLRFAYWSQDQARKKNMDMSKFNQLQRIREKMEKIYFGAGGKKSSLKKAILEGKGNRNRMVQLNGLGSIISIANDDDDLRTILGEDLFFEELEESEGLDGLGFAAGTAIASASGFIGMIAGFIKKIGGLFKRGSSEGQQQQIQNNTDDQEEKTRKFSFKNIKSFIAKRRAAKEARRNGTGSEIKMSNNTSSSKGTMLPPPEFDPSDMELDPLVVDDSLEDFDLNEDSDGFRVADDESNTDDNEDDKKKADGEGGIGKWIKENKVLAGSIGVGVLGLGAFITYKLVTRNKPKKGTKKPAFAGVASLDGSPKKKAKKKAKAPTQRTSAIKKVVLT